MVFANFIVFIRRNQRIANQFIHKVLKIIAFIIIITIIYYYYY